jgi:uncharacterized membrane protein
MSTGRLEAFSDGVIAILITVMLLELHVPDGTTWSALGHELPKLLTYVLSFVYLGIYWSNHHHMLQVTEHVTGGVMWANLHLLFWLSLVPFVTGWMGENHFQALPVAAYGLVLLCAACAYTFLARTLLAIHDKDSTLARALGKDLKGYLSIAIYVASIAIAFVQPWLACAGYVAVACIWIIPDRRFERLLRQRKAP